MACQCQDNRCQVRVRGASTLDGGVVSGRVTYSEANGSGQSHTFEVDPPNEHFQTQFIPSPPPDPASAITVTVENEDGESEIYHCHDVGDQWGACELEEQDRPSGSMGCDPQKGCSPSK